MRVVTTTPLPLDLFYLFTYSTTLATGSLRPTANSLSFACLHSPVYRCPLFLSIILQSCPNSTRLHHVELPKLRMMCLSDHSDVNILDVDVVALITLQLSFRSTSYCEALLLSLDGRGRSFPQQRWFVAKVRENPTFPTFLVCPQESWHQKELSHVTLYLLLSHLVLTRL